jgi:hypothetical protein
MTWYAQFKSSLPEAGRMIREENWQIQATPLARL